MRLDSAHSDLTIICGTKKYAVHKVVVCNQSKFFEKACNCGFEETYTDQIFLHEDPVLVDAMMITCILMTTRPKSLQIKTNLLLLMTPRSSWTKPRKWTPIRRLLGRPTTQQTDDGAIEEPLKSKVEKQLLHRFHPTIFPMAINAIYRSTPASDRGLRDMIITITTHNIRELRQIEPQIPFSEILSENLQFSSDLCLAFMDLYTPELGCTLWNRIRFTRTMIPNQPEEQPDFNGDV
ncbi:unnamed protein product [Penicillium salamii]|uniref:BTB domain-containing protein n=1 Tax=Penicillium salamii TaxID=1612424 RepID=A0A9W4JDK0_9EURO|nr:unnamed protein product [Penicillium salamii]CAG8389103.1 unnamed protein product [Penicillium salamii]CAG8391837.1 unnamed protein product [Penicillium salamii]CAG8397550.1 unnamed protein product [Penicillium salamii]